MAGAEAQVLQPPLQGAQPLPVVSVHGLEVVLLVDDPGLEGDLGAEAVLAAESLLGVVRTHRDVRPFRLLGHEGVRHRAQPVAVDLQQSVLAEHKADGRPLPRIVPPGPDNPLGEYAMRLGLPGYLIHGTNRPAGVGMRVTHGCVRMFPEDIEFLFGKIDVNTTVRIINEPIKMGWSGNDLVMEVHPVLEVVVPEVAGEAVDEATDENTEVVLDIIVEIKDPLTYVTEQFIETTAERAGQLDWQLVEQLVNRSEGIPTSVGRGIKNAATSAAFE